MIREQSGTNLYTLAWHPTGEFAILGLAWMQIFENWSQRPQNDLFMKLMVCERIFHPTLHTLYLARLLLPGNAKKCSILSQVFDRIQPNSVTVAISGCGALWAVCIHPRVTMDVSKCISNVLEAFWWFPPSTLASGIRICSTAEHAILVHVVVSLTINLQRSKSKSQHNFSIFL